MGWQAKGRHLDPPTDEREIARHYTLGASDRAVVDAKRGDANRLGFALVDLYLRHPGRVLGTGERPPVPAIGQNERNGPSDTHKRTKHELTRL